MDLITRTYYLPVSHLSHSHSAKLQDHLQLGATAALGGSWPLQVCQDDLPALTGLATSLTIFW